MKGTNTQISRYTQGLGVDEPLIMERGGQSFFYQTDGLGSIIELTDSNGTIAQSYVYNSFGNIEQQAGNIVNPYTYTGREIDTETGLYFYRARYYDSISGRFINEDPIGFAAGDNNFYRYVQNNPVNFMDPSGNGIFTFGACIGLSIWDVASTAKNIYKIGEELKEIRGRIEELSKSCSLTDEDNIKRQAEINELKGVAIEKEKERIDVIVEGSAYAVPIYVLCEASKVLPF